MVVLKTPSQVNSFVKRMNKEHSSHFREGCGCCGHFSFVERTDNRVVLKDFSEHMGCERTSVTVLAIIKRRAR